MWKMTDFAIIENSFQELWRTRDNKKAIRICKRLELQVSEKRINEFKDRLFENYDWIKNYDWMNDLIEWAFRFTDYKIYKIWNKSWNEN